MQHQSDESCSRFPHVELLKDWGRKTTSVLVYFNFFPTVDFFLCKGATCVCRSAVEFTNHWHVLLFLHLLGSALHTAPHYFPLLFDVTASLSQLFCGGRCCQVKARPAHILQASPWCVRPLLKRGARTHSVLHVTTSNSVVWGLFQFWYSACLPVCFVCVLVVV